MYHMKRYLLFAAVLLAACVVRLGILEGEYGQAAAYPGASLSKEEWNPLIAASVNEKKITVAVDGREYDSRTTPVYMDDRLNIMVSAEILAEGLKCSAHLYRDRELLVEKRNDAVRLKLNEPAMTVNGRQHPLSSPMIKKNGQYYVSLPEVAGEIGYSFEWDMQKNRASAGDNSKLASVVPARYDLREKERLGVVKNQEDTGMCWAFASLSAMESTLLPEESLQFSPDHMTFSNSFAVDVSEGGEYMMALAYLLAWQGPVYEKDDPFGDGKTEPGLLPVKHVQEVQIIEGKDYEKIKEAVFRYGGVQTAFYSSMGGGAKGSEFYNAGEHAYCYIGTERPNHEVLIIGWDDQYPKENFPVNVEGNGAFLCQNSWGDGFGDGGVFYVSYYDTNIGSHNVVYTQIEETDNYDHIYQSDLCGWVGQIGFNEETVYGANVYTAQEAEELSAVGFYAAGKNTEYSIYLVKEFNGPRSLENGTLIANGCMENIGYYTVPAVSGGKALLLEPGERYAVVLKLSTPEAIHPMAIEYAADEPTKDVDLTDGEGYISPDGKRWEHVEDAFSCNLCIKAYTKNR